MLHFPPPPPLTDREENLRIEVRAFLARELADRTPAQRAESWFGYDAEFSRKLGAMGWIGMTWPKKYGGHERTMGERYVVVEELLAAGAPVIAHWVADRQSGPLLLRFGTEEQKQDFLPRIARGECYFSIGMSEPNAGSDLAGVQTRASPVDGGFRMNGTKLWSGAMNSHYMIVFCRSGQKSDDRHGGMSQFLIDLKWPGITVRPIVDMTGAPHFSEVVFQDAFIPQSALIGELGQGWAQLTSELAFERSTPDRFLSSFTLLVELVRRLQQQPSERGTAAIARFAAHIVTLRRMSRSIAGMLERHEEAGLQAAVVKDLGAVVEQEIPEIARQIISTEPSLDSSDPLAAVLAYTVLHAPIYSIRGGTREILRGIIARGLGLR